MPVTSDALNSPPGITLDGLKGVTFETKTPEQAALDELIRRQTPVHPAYKYSEGRLLDELRAYIDSTYSGHYNQSEDNVQAMDLIMAGGHADGFCVGNILKYAQRYGKKKGFNRDDILKVIHYAIFLLHIHDKEGR